MTWNIIVINNKILSNIIKYGSKLSKFGKILNELLINKIIIPIIIKKAIILNLIILFSFIFCKIFLTFFFSNIVP